MIRATPPGRRWVALVDRGPVIAAALGILLTALALVVTLLLTALVLAAAGVPLHGPVSTGAMTAAVVVVGGVVGWRLERVLPVISSTYDRGKADRS